MFIVFSELSNCDRHFYKSPVPSILNQGMSIQQHHMCHKNAKLK